MILYFPWGKRPCHQICLYYNVHLLDDSIPMDGVFHGYDELDHERINLDFCWIPLEELRKDTKVYPLELIPYILEQRKETVHFVSRQIYLRGQGKKMLEVKFYDSVDDSLLKWAAVKEILQYQWGVI